MRNTFYIYKGEFNTFFNVVIFKLYYKLMLNIVLLYQLKDFH